MGWEEQLRCFNATIDALLARTSLSFSEVSNDVGDAMSHRVLCAVMGEDLLQLRFMANANRILAQSMLHVGKASRASEYKEFKATPREVKALGLVLDKYISEGEPGKPPHSQNGDALEENMLEHILSHYSITLSSFKFEMDDGGVEETKGGEFSLEQEEVAAAAKPPSSSSQPTPVKNASSNKVKPVVKYTAIFTGIVAVATAGFIIMSRRKK